MYLSDQSKEAEIVSAKSSEMNIVIPDKNGEFVSDVTLSNVYVLTAILIVYFVMAFIIIERVCGTRAVPNEV